MRLAAGAALFLAAALAAAAPAPAQAPPTTPYLRVEAGAHTAPVNRLAVDAAGRLLATASDDRTVRLWSLPDGAPAGVLRVPIAEEAEGELYAVALTPDGRRLFAAGFTGFAWDRSFALYIFDVVEKRMIGRLAPLPAPVVHLALSPDGARLAAALGGTAGIRVWDARNGRLLAEDTSYRGPARMVAFTPDAALVTTAADGLVRLYDPTGTKRAEAAPRRGARPYGLAVSPDGALIAIGYETHPAVDVLHLQGLRPAFMPDVSALDVAALPAVAWASDGRGGVQLHAAGAGRRGGVIRRWADFGLGPGTDLVAARDSIPHLLPLPGGGLAYAAADPGWGIVGPDGALARRPAPPSADPRAARDTLAVSADGQTVEWQGGAGRLRFEVATGRLVGAAARGADVALARTEAAGLAIANWRDAAPPRLNGQPIALGRGEIARSAAIAEGHVLVGTDTHLRLFDRSRRELAALATPGAVWALAVSPGAAVAVAALGDGTLRWYGLDGRGTLEERAALFVHADGVRWVLWTPEGFFDHAGAGGQDLVGVHLNRGRAEAPEWATFAQAYRALYAPAVVRARVAGDGKPAADRLAALGDVRAAIARQPRVSLTGACLPGPAGACTPLDLAQKVPETAGTVRIGLALEDRGLGLGPVDLFVNGRNLGRADPGGQTRFGLDIALDPGRNVIEARAWDAAARLFGTSSPLVLEAPGEAAGEGRLFVLAIGVDEYRNRDLRLNFAGADARRFAAEFAQAARPLYRDVVTTVLLDQDATRAGVIAALERLGREVGPNDTFLMYLAGHGVRAEPDDRFLFLPQDVEDASSWEALRRVAVTDETLVSLVSRIRARNGFLFIDTCFAGQITIDALANLGHETGRFMLAASSSVQEALDSYDGKNGVFAYAVAEALAGGAARDERGVVTALSLGEYVSRRVSELAREKGHAQDAVFRTARRDLRGFPVARVNR
ncbi:caspase family protein [Elioraea sp.]|uniref:caspase family protein n=1 Tax=Elioraea sp. TaxID=2185103 RepID=UPI00307DD59F